jgi:methionyl-tRNA formyltransferase
MKKGKRIIFLGNFEEGVLTLSKLISEGYDVPLCLGDKRSSVLREYCASINLDYADGRITQGNGFPDVIERKEPDLLVSNNFLYIIPESVLEKHKAINLHSSLLPHYKGRVPVLQTILNGDRKAGYTIHYMMPDADSGNILLQREISLSGKETSVDILRVLMFYEPSDMVTAVRRAIDGFEGKPMGQGRSLKVENFREILMEIDTLNVCRRKLRAFIKPYDLPYIILSGYRFFVHEAVCRNKPDSMGSGSVPLKLKDGYLILKTVSLNAEVGFAAEKLIGGLVVNLPVTAG